MTAVFLYSGKEAPNMGDPLIELFSIEGHHKSSNLLRYVPENRFSPRVINRRMAIEKLKINYKTQK
jgi:hypothetical protein